MAVAVNPIVRRVALPLALLVFVIIEVASALAMDTGPGARAGYDLQLNLRAPARALVTGVDPYDPDNLGYLADQDVSLPAGVYAPHALVVHAPVAALPLDVAAPLYAVLGAVAIAAAVLLIDRRLSPLSWGTLLVGAAVMSGPAVRSNLELGQPTPWILLGVTLYLFGRTHDRPWAGACGLVLACLKLQFALPILVLAVLLGDRRVVTRASAAMTLLGLPVVVQAVVASGGFDRAVSGLRRNLDFYADLPGNSGLSASARIDLSAAIGRIAEAGLVVDIACSAAVIGLVWWTVIRPGRADRSTVAVVMSVAPLLCLYHQRYDVLLLLPGIAAATSIAMAALAVVAASWSAAGERSVEIATGLSGPKATSLTSALTTVLLVIAIVDVGASAARDQGPG